MASDRLIAMATLASGWHASIGNQPQIDPHVCICRVVSHTPTEEDRHNILVVGLRRARIVQEEDTGTTVPHRHSRCFRRYLPDGRDAERAVLKRRLLDSFRNLIPDVAGSKKTCTN